MSEPWPSLEAEWEALRALPHDRQSQAQHRVLGDRVLEQARRDPNSLWGWFLGSSPQQRQNGALLPWLIRASRFSVPKRCLKPMLQAAVEERDPSFNKTFVAPCVMTYGIRQVTELLLEWLERGSDAEKAGAANALYWVGDPMLQSRKSFCGDLSDLQARQRDLLLQEFVANPSLEVRRSILSRLSLDPAKYPEHLRHLVPEAIRIARESPDDYLRHRVEIQLGAPGPLRPLPKR